MRQIYLDHAAGTPLRTEALQAMLPFLQSEFGNPLSIHGFGDAPRQAMETARKQVADLIGATPNEIYFTASGSESNNMALKGTAWMNRKKGNHIVVSSIEHQSVLNSAATLEKTWLRSHARARRRLRLGRSRCSGQGRTQRYHPGVRDARQQ